MPYDDDQFDRAEFDRQFNKTQALAHKGFKVVGVAALVMMTMALAALGFVCWVIVQLLQHFGII